MIHDTCYHSSPGYAKLRPFTQFAGLFRGWYYYIWFMLNFYQSILDYIGYLYIFKQDQFVRFISKQNDITTINVLYKVYNPRYPTNRRI